MEIEEVIDFLGTDTVYAVFSPTGLKYLSLRVRQETLGIDPLPIDLRQPEKKEGQNAMITKVIKETINFLENGRHTMPLDFSSFTDFQQRVFAAVGRIEPGTITTYKGVAETLGIPGGAQAVGNAVAKNPVAYFLPTHRVLPQRGIGICRTGAGHLREKLLAHEGHDLSQLRGNYICTRKKCCME
ncbi:MAG TPA: methylated-DNA--[protein]-cysteine S-methyltransferase [Firmicutes bacterium]|jgi:O-6-methylguanine DNA methyltransferase|nr:methylated-DNA--[protein]-cysteine S-methyltransferase [Bacillota bacterium]